MANFYISSEGASQCLALHCETKVFAWDLFMTDDIENFYINIHMK